jgi:hypothetical protein
LKGTELNWIELSLWDYKRSIWLNRT